VARVVADAAGIGTRPVVVSGDCTTAPGRTRLDQAQAMEWARTLTCFHLDGSHDESIRRLTSEA
jgi:hypothetical protein